MPSARSKTRSRLGLSVWQWLYLLSLPVAIIAFFYPNSFWGPLDEGDLAYNYGDYSWGETLHRLFLPQENKVFLFGQWRPLPLGLYFKILTSSLNVSPFTYHVVDWLLSWACALAFAWGLVTLARTALPMARHAAWAMAALMWWTPTWMLLTNQVTPDPWMQPGMIGLFWGLLYSPVQELPRWIRRNAVRYPLGVLAGFLALQSHEVTFVMLPWSAFMLWAFRMAKLSKLTYKEILAPVALTVVWILLYRSLDPSHANRTEITTSYAPSQLLWAARYYFAMGIYGLDHFWVKTLGIEARFLGMQPAATPHAFLLTAAGAVLILWPRHKAQGAQAWGLRITWLYVAAGVACTLPLLAMVNRALVYYGHKLNFFIAAFLAIRLFLIIKPAKSALAESWRGRVAIALYLAGLISATHTLFYDWNWVKHFGGMAMQFHQRVLAHPEASQCTQNSPCCLQILPNSGWLSNVATVNWCDGAPYPPRFVEPGKPCARTIQVQGLW